MKHLVLDIAWLMALVALGFASILIDARVGFSTLLALIVGNAT